MNKNVYLNVRLTESENSAFERWANQMEMSKSDYLRLLIRMKMAQERERNKNENKEGRQLNLI